MSARAFEIMANLAKRRPLRGIQTVCETQHQISTRKLEQYTETAGDELAGYAFNLRNEFDKIAKERDQLLTELAALRATHPAPDAEAVEAMPVRWTGNPDADLALVLIDRIDAPEDESRLDQLEQIVMRLGKATTVPAGSRVVPAGEVAVSSDQIARMADDLAYAIYNLAGSRVCDLSPGVVESTCPAITALIVERNLRALLEVKP